MKNVTLEESKQIQLDMLLYIKKICEEHNLRYYLAYGTLIGAVRHKGFIPWDDDVDILMPREDYYKFIKCVEEDKPVHYKLISYDTNKKYTLPLPKLIDTRTIMRQNYAWKEKVDLGVYIDIFIIDGAGNTEAEAIGRIEKAYLIFQDWYRATMQINVPGENPLISFLKWIKFSPQRRKGTRHYLKVMESYISTKSFDDTKYVSMMHLATKDYWERSWFGDEVCMLEFEQNMFRVPQNYDAVLRDYGDYMQLPPIEKRVSEHSYTVYWKNK